MATALPWGLRIESKFTTQRGISIPARERDALASNDLRVHGVLAVLFWAGIRDVDGEWFLVDAAESFRTASGQAASLKASEVPRLAVTQSWLRPIRDHVTNVWRPFLHAYLDEALAGHAALLEELSFRHRDRTLHERLRKEDFLNAEHRESMEAVINAHGPAGAGRIFQDLLAYLLGMAGYRTVRINPVGVPDIEVSALEQKQRRSKIRVDFTPAQLNELVQVCRSAGKSDLAKALQSASTLSIPARRRSR